jgi:hypothetical protein
MSRKCKSCFVLIGKSGFGGWIDVCDDICMVFQYKILRIIPNAKLTWSVINIVILNFKSSRYMKFIPPFTKKLEIQVKATV